MERPLHAHFWAVHRDHEMREVFAHCAGPRHDAEMTALAYYTAAICEQERRHVPLIGPAVDRRTMTLVYRVANSETIKSLMCFCCAQIYTWVASWEKMYGGPGSSPCPEAWNSKSEIRMYAVADSILKLHREDEKVSA